MKETEHKTIKVNYQYKRGCPYSDSHKLIVKYAKHNAKKLKLSGKKKLSIQR